MKQTGDSELQVWEEAATAKSRQLGQVELDSSRIYPVEADAIIRLTKRMAHRRHGKTTGLLP